MSDLTLTPIHLRAGTWVALIKGDSKGTPQVRVTLHGEPIDSVELSEDKSEDGWTLKVRIPPESISEGVQTFLVRDGADDTKLGEFAVIAGEAAGEDLRAEVDLLRAELDLLKRAFRRHCLETM